MGPVCGGASVKNEKRRKLVDRIPAIKIASQCSLTRSVTTGPGRQALFSDGLLPWILSVASSINGNHSVLLNLRLTYGT